MDHERGPAAGPITKAIEATQARREPSHPTIPTLCVPRAGAKKFIYVLRENRRHHRFQARRFFARNVHRFFLRRDSGITSSTSAAAML